MCHSRDFKSRSRTRNGFRGYMERWRCAAPAGIFVVQGVPQGHGDCSENNQRIERNVTERLHVS